MEEIWKDIDGYEGYYQISNLGRVKSLGRNIYRKSDGKFSRYKPESIKIPVCNTDGYPSIKLCVNGENKTYGIHILVAKAFIENPDNLPEVNHIDTNRKNNRVDNLEWCTHQENVAHSRRLGHYKGRVGEKNPNYGNHILHDIYSKNPQLAIEKLSRPGKQNGRCRKVTLEDKSGHYENFDYIRECALWAKDRFSIEYTIPTIHQQLIRCNKTNTLFYGYTVTID